jgi:hypothetical protein
MPELTVAVHCSISITSMVQKGKLEASAPAAVRALKSVDLPTFGNPTTPACKMLKKQYF